MFCSVCGSQQPATTKFCGECGSRIQMELQPDLSFAEQVETTSPKRFCVNCGHPYDPSHKFCNSCGQPIAVAKAASPSQTISPPQTASPSHTVSPSQAVSPSQTVSGFAVAVAQQTEPPGELEPVANVPPYARFALSSLALATMASVVAFNIADGAARDQWDHTASTTAAVAFFCLLGASVVRNWNKLKRNVPSETDVARKKLLTRSIVFGILFISTGALMGFAVGTSGAETNQFIADSHQAVQLADRISASRTSAARTVPAQLAMYKAIEADVLEWDSVLKRMQHDLDVYDKKYPSQHQTTVTLMQSAEIGLKRSDLLRRQIALAKEIEPLPPEAQWSAWESRMQPLWDQETALDNNK